MARRRKGLPVDGWLVIDKPSGVGSTDVVSKARWALRAQKAGHAGTLDPLATGVLPIAFGEATKTIPYMAEGLKRYTFALRFGVVTETDDSEGSAMETSDARPSDEAIRAALPALSGLVMQTPPAYSAVKVDGARAYDLAREGERPELAARPLEVERFELIERPDADRAVFAYECGKGGYVRAAARDLGRALGCGAHVTALRRLATGPFDESMAVPFAALDAMREDEAAAPLLPVSAGLGEVPALIVTRDAAAQLRSGQPAPAAGPALDYGDTAWASLGGAPVAIGVWRGGLLHPKRVLSPAAGRDA